MENTEPIKSGMISQIESILPKAICRDLWQVVQLLETAVRQEHFTAWSVANSHFRISATYADEWRTVPANTSTFTQDQGESHPFFDLGSLTKPILGGSLFMLGHNSPKAFLDAVFQDHLFTDHPALNYASLFSHQAGLPSWLYFGRALYNDQSKMLTGFNQHFMDAALQSDDRIETFRSRLFKGIFEWKNLQAPGHVAYSDCGYYVLARLMEQGIVADMGGWRRALATLNSRLGTRFFHASLSPASSAHAIPFFPYIVTARDDSRGTDSWKKFGPTLDTNANILATLSPWKPQLSLHAGLFGSVEDLEQSVSFFQREWPIIRKQLEDARPNFKAKRLEQIRNRRFFYCFDTPTSLQTLSAALPNDFANTFGHLGYTGTSAWFQVTQEEQNEKSQMPPYWIFLTNRTASRRTELRTDAAPRLYRIDKGTTTLYAWNKSRNGQPFDLTNMEVISKDDWHELRLRFNEASQTLWDQSCCKMFADINETRRKIGALLFRAH